MNMGDDESKRTSDEDREIMSNAGTASERTRGWGSSVAMPTERSENFGASLRRLWRILAPERLRIIVVAVLAITSVSLVVLGPRLLGQATDVIVDGLRSPEGIDFDDLHSSLEFIVAIYLASWVLSYGQGYLLAGVVQRAMHSLREMVETKLNRLPLAYLDAQARGDFLSRVTNDIDNLAQSLQQTMAMILTSVLTLIGVVVMMLIISPLMTLVALITVPVSLWAMKMIAARARPRFMQQWAHTGNLNGQVEEVFTGHEVVAAFGRREEVAATFREHNDRLHDASLGAQFMSSLIQPMMMFVGNVQYVMIAVIGGLRITSGAITVGDMQALIQYARQFSQPMSQLASMATVFQSGIASLERVIEVLDADEQSPDPGSAPLATPVGGRVVFEDVAFSYLPGVPLIEKLSVVAEPGQTVAIVGPTGAGKTTLVNLIMRFYEIDGGRILLDGRDIADLSRDELRSQVGMVLQDTWLFEGTIRDNLAYGNPDATEDEIMEAARVTYVDRFVRHLPDGYDTVIAENGDNISQGEKQLLTIARAFLNDPTILILDEATSSVDTRTEVLIQEAMNSVREHRTSFVIAHRLSTIRGADIILVMENGNIVEQGSHDELLRTGGAYANLYNSQFAGAARTDELA
ncbi:MAG: ABC transporter ATP-binding protein [Acidimicrobiales bacterium]